MKKIICLTFAISCIVSSFSVAQDSLNATIVKVEMLGRAQPDHIILRWAPTTPMAWHYCNKYGMKLERYTVIRNGKALDVPEKKEYTSLFKPLPLAEWEAIAENNEYALVAAQAIHGESFEVTENFSSDISTAINQAKEMEQRHLFALFAADQSKEVAKASGLMYEDHEVNKNEKYIYTISCVVPKEVMSIDTGHVYMGLADFFELPAPEGVHVEFDDTLIMVSWEGRRFQEFYNSFIVERSDDEGKTFHSISTLPIVNPLNEKGEYPEYIFKADSVSQYNKKYVYRVKGINPFGETSPPSDTASVICRPKLNYVPHITGYQIGKNGNILVQWTFPKEGINNILGFTLKRASTLKGDFKTVVTGLLPTDTVALDPSPLNSNYYMIVAYDNYGNQKTSLPTLAMLEDSIPPIPPVHLVGSIDSLGVVTLTWDANLEKDLLGYRVYQSNFPNREFIQVTTKPVTENGFVDTIEIKTLTRKSYYKIVAIDTHFNPSDFSEVLALERPDVVPPVPPQIESIDVNEKGIHLRWFNSSSEDVEKHVVYRKSSTESGWSPIYTALAKDSIVFYSDENSIPGELYAYTLIAVDGSGLESEPARPVSRKRIESSKQEEIKNITAKVDRTNLAINLSWKYSVSGVTKYFIYRAEEKGDLVLYKEIPGTAPFFKDTDLKTNTLYTYRIQAQFENGALSSFSKEIIVNY